jgi:mitogen-activated protein kinase kinase kinase 3
MAPEIMRGDKYSRKGDIYSFGGCLIEMAVAGDPWQGRFTSAVDAMMLIPSDPSVKMEIPSSLSVYARSFIDICLEWDKEKRPTAEKLAEHPWIRGEVMKL